VTKVKTDWHSRLGEEEVECLIRIKKEGPPPGSDAAVDQGCRRETLQGKATQRRNIAEITAVVGSQAFCIDKVSFSLASHSVTVSALL